MQHQDINEYVKEKFIFVYDRRLLRHLRANNHRYLVEAINPRCMKTYWMFEGTKNMKNARIKRYNCAKITTSLL